MKKKILCSLMLFLFIFMAFLGIVKGADTEDDTIKIQAKVVFGDYEDYNGKRYNENGGSTYKPYFQLKLLPSNMKVGDVVPGTLVVNDNSGARKDWCYQFEAEWDVPKVSGSTTGYYVELVNKDGTALNDGKVTLNNKKFDVYYLNDDSFGNPGENSGEKSDNGKIYQTASADIKHNNDGDTYIYLDPETDFNGNADKLDIAVKKRWDGHNDKNLNIHPNEKIIVQLQRWDETKGWLEFNTTNFNKDNVDVYQNTSLFPSQTYEFPNYFEIKDANGNNHFVSCNILDDKYPKASNGGQDYYTYSQGKRYFYKEVLDDGTVKYWGKKENGQFKNEIDPKLFDYGYVSNSDNGSGLNPYNKNYADPSNSSLRLWLYNDLDEVQLNNVVLSLEKSSHTPSFEGYYFSWTGLPKGEYRVIETKSFIDNNNNDKYDEGIDTDTSSEYNYMSFPPARDSNGVLHIMNYTKDVVLEISKEWYDGQNNLLDAGKYSGKIKFNLYRSLEKYEDPKVADLELVYENVETEANGTLIMRTKDYPKMDKFNDDEKKYYYYIQETGVVGMENSEFSLLNGNADNFIPGIEGNYGISYEDSVARKYIIKNTPTVGFQLEKKWQVEGKEYKYNDIDSNVASPEFEIYRGKKSGVPVKNGSSYSVEDSTLEKIADAKIGKDGTLKIVYGEKQEKVSDSLIKSPELLEEYSVVLGDKYELYVDIDSKNDAYKGVKYTKNGEEVLNEAGKNKIWTSKNSEWFNINGENINGCNLYDTIFFGIKDGRTIFVKPQKDSVLRLDFPIFENGKKFRIDLRDYTNNSTKLEFEIVPGEVEKEITDFYGEKIKQKYTCTRQGDRYVIEMDAPAGANWALLSSSGVVRLQQVTLIDKETSGTEPYYYYAREKAGENYKIVNGTEDGFAPIGNDEDGKYCVKLIAKGDDKAAVKVVAVNDLKIEQKQETPVEPEKPTEPVEPEKPTDPVEPEKPSEPSNPEQPTEPVAPDNTNPQEPEKQPEVSKPVEEKNEIKSENSKTSDDIGKYVIIFVISIIAIVIVSKKRKSKRR